MRLKMNWDALGITTSVACAIHCALLPLFISTLPLFGINIIHNLVFEYGMIALAFVVGIFALSHGYRDCHHRLLPSFIFTIGICFLLAKQIWHQWELFLLPPAVIAIIFAHYINYKLSKSNILVLTKKPIHP
jgi:hypothetical protein